MFSDLAPQSLWDVADLKVLGTHLGRNRETGRHGKADLRHLCEACSLSSEDGFHFLAAFFEIVDELVLIHGSSCQA